MRVSVFTADDYNSGDGMLTSVWGPGMWHYLHTMSFNYPINPTPQQKKHFDLVIEKDHYLRAKFVFDQPGYIRMVAP